MASAALCFKAALIVMRDFCVSGPCLVMQLLRDPF